MKPLIKILRVLIIASPAFLFGWLLWQNAVPSGNFSAVYNFERTPWISALRPGNRLSEISEAAGIKTQTLIDDPVYFDINLPRNFEKMILEIDYKNPKNQPFKIGAYTSRADWKFALKDWDISGEKGGWQTGRAEFETAGLDKAGNKITFILSLPKIRYLGGGVEIGEIRMSAIRQKIWPY